MPDYDNDIVFKPAMTWGDLKEFAKQNKLFAPHVTRDDFFIGVLFFRSNGEIRANGTIITENRTYEHMKNIIDNLYGE